MPTWHRSYFVKLWLTTDSDVPCLAATYFTNNSYYLSLAFCLQLLFTGGRSVSFLCHSALGSCVQSLCTMLFLLMNYQVHMLIGYEIGSFVGAVLQFESPSQCAQTAVSASVRRSGSSVGAFLPLGATALDEPWPPQQPVSITLCLLSSLSTALSSLLSSLLQHRIQLSSFFHHHLFLILLRLIVGFRNKLFLRCGVNLEVQGHHPWLVWHGRPYQ
jgi:hypothetical protein